MLYNPICRVPHGVQCIFYGKLIQLLRALAKFPDHVILFTGANADHGGYVINELFGDYVARYPKRSIFIQSLGRENYIAAMTYAALVVGNSSSGLAEAPTFRIGTVNIGDRQKGRLKAKSIIDCEPTKASIKKAIKTLYSEDFQNILPTINNPYSKVNGTEKIIKVLRDVILPKELKKEFHNI